MFLLITERYDQRDTSEGAHYLLFAEYRDADAFARRLAVDYHECPELPLEGDFSSSTVKGDVMYYHGRVIISWTVQPRSPGGAIGDSYCISVETVGQVSPDTRLDFWNQRLS